MIRLNFGPCALKYKSTAYCCYRGLTINWNLRACTANRSIAHSLEMNRHQISWIAIQEEEGLFCKDRLQHRLALCCCEKGKIDVNRIRSDWPFLHHQSRLRTVHLFNWDRGFESHLRLLRSLLLQFLLLQYPLLQYPFSIFFFLGSVSLRIYL